MGITRMASTRRKRGTPPAPNSRQPVPGRRAAAKQDREREIVNAAIRLFAEEGFGGQTRVLAQRLGISQPALYRHFPTKERLIERVYQEVFLRRWNPYWEALLDDRSVELEERLTAFYTDYAKTVMDYDWIRITMHAALAGNPITSNYVSLVRDRIIVRVCRAFREHAGLSAVTDNALTPAEMELAWDLQGNVVYLAIRTFIYGMPPLESTEAAVGNFVHAFVHGASSTMKALDAGTRLRRPSRARGE